MQYQTFTHTANDEFTFDANALLGVVERNPSKATVGLVAKCLNDFCDEEVATLILAPGIKREFDTQGTARKLFERIKQEIEMQ